MSTPSDRDDWPVEAIMAEAAEPRQVRSARRPRRGLPLLLFLATCFTTYTTGGPYFFASLMTILTAHELGHYFTAKACRVPASLPYFLPMPFGVIGTLGAVIAMHPGMGNRRSLFDIAIAGPLAGLVPAIVFSIVGLQWSDVVMEDGAGHMKLGEPLFFRWLAEWVVGPVPEGHDLKLHPMAYAGWVGVLITALNLIPISQLDGGHIIYALFRAASRPIATGLLVAALAAVIWFDYWGWILMIVLLLLIGPAHPPTANDNMPLGPVRFVVGLVTLLFPIIGFTPTPFSFNR